MRVPPKSASSIRSPNGTVCTSRTKKGEQRGKRQGGGGQGRLAARVHEIVETLLSPLFAQAGRFLARGGQNLAVIFNRNDGKTSRSGEGEQAALVAKFEPGFQRRAPFDTGDLSQSRAFSFAT